MYVREGIVTGRLIREPRGPNGFGYDPIFVPDGYEVTTAEMDPADKDKISHRGRALRALAPEIRRYVR
jgi:XTP/dITP diphosphohydrolase